MEVTGSEVTASNVDRLATIEARFGGRQDRGIIVPLYDAASKKLGGKPVSLAAAERMIEAIKPGDNVILMDGMGAMPPMPYGETDGPLGVASLARAVRLGLGALPIVVTPARDMEATHATVQAAGLNVLDYSEAKNTGISAATMVTFPVVEAEESKKFAANIMNEYSPKLVASVELMGPNKKGIKHFSPGLPFEAKGKAAGMEYIFYEAEARKILTIACIDQGNEMGSGTIEEEVRRIVPYGDVCRCPCGAGMACAVKADVTFPCALSNWGAYAITAMLGFLLNKPEILQDIDTERRMLEACIMGRSVDGVIGKLTKSVDGVNCETQQAFITMLHTIIDNALSGAIVNFAKSEF